MSHWNTTTALCEICNELTMLDEISDGICTHCRDNYEAHRMYQIHKLGFRRWVVIDCYTAAIVTHPMPKLDAICRRNELNNAPPPSYYQRKQDTPR